MAEEYLPSENENQTEEIVESAPSTLAVITQSEYAAMVATANLKGNRRSVDEFSKKAMAYANHSQGVALSMFYTLPRAGKQIVGASVRYAEIVAPCWKNNSAGSRIIGETDKTVTAQGIFLDYEANIRNVKEIPRRITASDGRKFGDDMILTTAKAVLSIAYRDSILKGGVPQALWTPPYEEAKMTAVGKAISHSARIDAAMEYMMKLGVTEWQILNAVGVGSPKDLEIDHLVTLRTLCEEIKSRTRTIEEVFGTPYDKEIDALFTQLKKNESEKRMLRNSYMGRAGELLEYLRKQVAPSASSKPVETQAPPQTEQAQEGNGHGKGGRKKKDAASEKPADPEAKTEPAEKAESKPAAESKPEPEAGSFSF